MNRVSSIELALQNEKTEMEFYRQEAKRSRNQLAQAMFDNLARDEQEHMERIGRLHKELIQRGVWPEDMPLTVAGTDIRATLSNVVARLDAAQDHDDDDLRALEKAAQFEAKGAQLYTNLARDSAGAERSFFEFLARIEREHQLSVSDSLTYLKDPAAWSMQHERAGLDGA